MRNHLLLCAFLLICGGVNAQTQLLGSPTTLVKNRGAFMSDSLLYIPKRSKTPSDSGAIRYQISDSAIYVWTGSQWIKAGAGGTVTSITAGTGLSGGTITSSGTIAADTTVLSTRLWRQKAVDSLQANINLKVNISDTATMLSPYLRKADTATLSNRINLKVNISDTASMLTPYVRAAGYGLTKSSQSLLVDTAAIATRARVQKGIDSLGSVKGTVSSVATGYGLSGGTITTTGTLSADTSAMATRARVQKGIDSLGAAKQNVLTNPVTGTGTTNYVAKFTGTSAVGNSQIFDDGTNVGIGITTGMSERFNVSSSTANANASISSSWASGGAFLRFGNVTNADGLYVGYNNPAGTLFGGLGGANGGVIMGYGAYPIGFGTNATERIRITSAGEVLVNTTSDAGAYSLQNSGAFYNTGGAVLAATSGSVGIGTSSPLYKLQVENSANNFALSVKATSSNELQLSGNMTANDNSGTIRAVTSGGAAYAPLTIDASQVTTKISSVLSTFINTAGEFFVNTTTDAGDYKLQVNGNIYGAAGANLAMTSGNVGVGLVPAGQSGFKTIEIGGTGVSGLIDVYQGTNRQLRIYNSSNDSYLANNTNGGWMIFRTTTSGGTQSNALSITDASELLVNTTSDAGAYALQVSGAIYNTTGAVFAATSGSVGIGTASPAEKLVVSGSFDTKAEIISTTSGTNSNATLNLKTATEGSYALQTGNAVSGGLRIYDLTAAAERMRITSTGRILAGTTSSISGGLNEQRVQSYGTDDLAGFSALRVSANTGGSRLVLGKSRGATYTIVNDGDGLGIISFQGADGSTLYRSAEISGQVDGTPSAGSVPGRLVFETNMSERMRIKSDGEILIATTTDAGDYKLQVVGNVYSLGVSSKGTIESLGTYGQFYTDSTTNVPALFLNQTLTGSSAQPTIVAYPVWNTTGNVDAISLVITNTASGSASNYLSFTGGGGDFKVTKNAEIMTAAPTGGSTKKWKLGEAATVSPTSPNRTIRVEIDGTVYYIHAKTTND